MPGFILCSPQAELSAPSSPFLPGSAFEEPETSPVEETPAHPEPHKAELGSEWAAEEQPLPELYQRLLLEAMEPAEPVAGYISNPGTLDPEPPPEPEPSPISVFPSSAFLPPALCCPGNLTLDRVKLSGSSGPR